MPLAVAPEVNVNGTWLATAWVTTPDSDITGDTGKTMTVRDIQYWKWTVSVDGGAVQVYRLLVAGADATSIPPGTLTLPIGSYRTRTRIVDTPERIEKPSGTFEVTA